MEDIKKYKYEYNGYNLEIDLGLVARQADGACLLTYGHNTILSTVCIKENDDLDIDFFPLMVIYQEKLYAAGKIPGGFLKREGRPRDHETLISRLIDRPIRPMFDDNYKDEVQIVNTVLSSDPNIFGAVFAIFASSLSLMLSSSPFCEPVSGVVIGYIDNKFIINPTKEEIEISKLNLTVAGTIDSITMVEAGADFLDESIIEEALMIAHTEIIKLCNIQLKIYEENKKNKKVVKEKDIDKDLYKEIYDFIYQDIKDAMIIVEKQSRTNALDSCLEKVLQKYENTNFFKTVDDVKIFDDERLNKFKKDIKFIYDDIVEKEFRRLIVVKKIRPDGRGVSDIRPLSSMVDILPRCHGSSLFTRGQTQSLGVVTLGPLSDNQILDGLDKEESKRFMFHYNFPPFSVGETGRYGAPGRREIGHGALAERALSYTLPSEDEFPYAIRCVSEILESNGSSSQASICSCSMALMSAGVPIKSQIAGIAMGLIATDLDNYTILTDIQGMEDHLGDMDFKVAGNEVGITALQMDIKLKGITLQIIKKALQEAKKARIKILNHMNETINKPKSEVSKYAPKIVKGIINKDKIKDVIGSGGKVINSIIEKYDNVKIDIEQDGKIFILHENLLTAKAALDYIINLVKVAEVGKIYEGIVKRIEDYGVFIELWPGCEGLCHISKLDIKKVEKCQDIVFIGSKILVKVIKINEKGQIDLSRKDVLLAETKEVKK